MVEHELLADSGILIVRPSGPLSESDFATLASETDAYIAEHGALKGLMICTEQFPGWENLQGFFSHLKFVRDHHRKISKVAMVSDSDVLAMLPTLAGFFVNAEVKHFKSQVETEARAWLID